VLATTRHRQFPVSGALGFLAATRGGVCSGGGMPRRPGLPLCPFFSVIATLPSLTAKLGQIMGIGRRVPVEESRYERDRRRFYTTRVPPWRAETSASKFFVIIRLASRFLLDGWKPIVESNPRGKSHHDGGHTSWLSSNLPLWFSRNAWCRRPGHDGGYPPPGVFCPRRRRGQRRNRPPAILPLDKASAPPRESPRVSPGALKRPGPGRER